MHVLRIMVVAGALFLGGQPLVSAADQGESLRKQTGTPLPLRSASASLVPPAGGTPAVSTVPATPSLVNQPGANAASPEANFENRPLAFAGSGRPRAERRDYGGPSILPGLLAVAAVGGVFLLILFLMKKYLPGHRQMFSHPAMEVLGRTHLDPKRYVSLLRVGKRVVVVGVSPDEMRPLSEITDEEEITGILEVARPKTEAGLTVFGRLFQRSLRRNEAEEARVMARVAAEGIDRQMSSIRTGLEELHAGERAGDRGNEARPGRRVDRVG